MLKELYSPYNALLVGKRAILSGENSFLWAINDEISNR